MMPLPLYAMILYDTATQRGKAQTDADRSNRRTDEQTASSAVRPPPAARQCTVQCSGVHRHWWRATAVRLPCPSSTDHGGREVGVGRRGATGDQSEAAADREADSTIEGGWHRIAWHRVALQWRQRRACAFVAIIAPIHQPHSISTAHTTHTRRTDWRVQPSPDDHSDPIRCCSKMVAKGSQQIKIQIQLDHDQHKCEMHDTRKNYV